MLTSQMKQPINPWVAAYPNRNGGWGDDGAMRAYTRHDNDKGKHNKPKRGSRVDKIDENCR